MALPKGYKHTQEWKDNNSKLMKGRVLTDEWRRKISIANSGKKRSDAIRSKMSKDRKGRKVWNKGLKTGKLSVETRIKMSVARKGENAPNWKGGITPLNEAIRKSLEYRLWRESVFERDNYTCIWCGKRGVELNADHIKPFSLFPELRFAIDNGRTLCLPCHKTTDTYGGLTRLLK